MGSDHSQFDPIHKPYLDQWKERQENPRRRVTHETHTNETKDRVLAELDPAQKEVRTETKHDVVGKRLASHKGKVREDTKAKNRRRDKKGRTKKDV